MDNDWLLTHEVARLIRMPVSTVRYWRHKGIGPKGTRVGKRVLYRRCDVESWLETKEATEHVTPNKQ